MKTLTKDSFAIQKQYVYGDQVMGHLYRVLNKELELHERYLIPIDTMAEIAEIRKKLVSLTSKNVELLIPLKFIELGKQGQFDQVIFVYIFSKTRDYGIIGGPERGNWYIQELMEFA